MHKMKFLDEICYNHATLYRCMSTAREFPKSIQGAAVAAWLSSWLAEQEDRGSIPGLATWIFRDWLSPASKSRYGWNTTDTTLILNTTRNNLNPSKALYCILFSDPSEY